MPDIANTPIKICSRGCVLIGAEPIQSFNDGTPEAIVAEAMYEDVARAALTNSRWRFATNQAILNRIATPPTGRFDAAYQLPASYLMINAITVRDQPIKYDIYGDKAFCDADANDDVVADYIFRANESNWPPYFVIAVEYMMAAMFATSIARDSQMSSMMEQKANFHLVQARRLDSQQQTTRKLHTTRFIAQRRS
jgi:hypothetical protein